MSWSRVELMQKKKSSKHDLIMLHSLRVRGRRWMLRMQQHEWTSCSEVHQSSGRFGACWFKPRPAEGAVTSHSCHVAPRWDQRNSRQCVAHLTKGKCGVPLTNALVWNVHSLLYWITVRSSARFHQQEVYLFSSVPNNTRADGDGKVFTPTMQTIQLILKITSYSVSEKSSLPITRSL